MASRLHLEVRKFFSLHALCRRDIFLESLPGFAARYARKTLRLNEVFCLIGCAQGDEGDAWAAVGWELTTYPDIPSFKFVRLLTPPQERQTDVHVPGVDEFAFHKGLRYGTILVDLERQGVLDPLPDQTAGSLAAWLNVRPEFKSVSATAPAPKGHRKAPQAGC